MRMVSRKDSKQWEWQLEEILLQNIVDYPRYVSLSQAATYLNSLPIIEEVVAGSKWKLNMKIFSVWKTSGGFTWLQI